MPCIKVDTDLEIVSKTHETLVIHDSSFRYSLSYMSGFGAIVFAGDIELDLGLCAEEATDCMMYFIRRT